MKSFVKRGLSLTLVTLLLCGTLTGCGGNNDEPDTGTTPPVSSSDDTGVNPPGDLGDPSGDVNFGLQGPGDTQFDDVDYNGSQPGVSGVGDPVEGNQFVYNPTDGEDITEPTVPADPGLNLINDEDTGDGDLDEGEGDGNGDMEVTPPPAEDVTPPVEEPTEEVPPAIALPNTGMFLEDD